MDAHLKVMSVSVTRSLGRRDAAVASGQCEAVSTARSTVVAALQDKQ